MFEKIPSEIIDRMKELEEIDQIDRINGTPVLKRLRQIPSETGKFLAIQAALAPEGKFIEIGTSAGYSSLWIGLACLERGNSLITFELLEEKIEIAVQTFQKTNMEKIINLVHGDARKFLPEHNNISFCFLDAEKEVYYDLYDMIVPKLVKGGILIADNAISHEKALRPTIQKAFQDIRIDAVVVPIGTGELLCRKI
ncbi:MAG: class I SAM-dependent methyltransferase [Candidatus Lokiarchaeota archaeon]|nr:class I SAM-dependent methyltransferase [Candidatus Lokiarchaeota archaeon]